MKGKNCGYTIRIAAIIRYSLFTLQSGALVNDYCNSSKVFSNEGSTLFIKYLHSGKS